MSAPSNVVQFSPELVDLGIAGWPVQVLPVFTWVSTQQWNVNSASDQLLGFAVPADEISSVNCIACVTNVFMVLYHYPCWLNPIAFLIYFAIDELLLQWSYFVRDL